MIKKDIFSSSTPTLIRNKHMTKTSQTPKVLYQIRVTRVSRPSVRRTKCKERADSRIPSFSINIKNKQSIQLNVSIFSQLIVG
jgi:hypothetical protein